MFQCQKQSIGKEPLRFTLVYRLNSIKAELDGDTILFVFGESIWLVSYLAQYDWDNPAPHSTEDSFKIGNLSREKSTPKTETFTNTQITLPTKA